MRAVRIFGSNSHWGPKGWAPDDQPFEATDVPEAGCVLQAFFGPIPDDVLDGLRVRDALASAMLTRVVGETRHATLDEATDALLEQDESSPADGYPWHVTLIYDKPTYLPEDPAQGSRYRWWDIEAARQLDETFRPEAEGVLDVLTAHVSLVLGAEFFAAKLDSTDRTFFIAEGRPVSFFPRFGGSATLSTGRTAESFPSEQLSERLQALDPKTWNEHRWLRRAVSWYVAALNLEDRWRKFQSLCFVLEVLSQKLGRRYRNDVIARLGYGTESGAGDAVSALLWATDRMPLQGWFNVMALEFDPPNASTDAAQFASVKKARDEMSHGAIVDADELPISDASELARKFLDLALCRLLP